MRRALCPGGAVHRHHPPASAALREYARHVADAAKDHLFVALSGRSRRPRRVSAAARGAVSGCDGVRGSGETPAASAEASAASGPWPSPSATSTTTPSLIRTAPGVAAHVLARLGDRHATPAAQRRRLVRLDPPGRDAREDDGTLPGLEAISKTCDCRISAEAVARAAAGGIAVAHAGLHVAHARPLSSARISTPCPSRPRRHRPGSRRPACLMRFVASSLATSATRPASVSSNPTRAARSHCRRRPPPLRCVR